MKIKVMERQNKLKRLGFTGVVGVVVCIIGCSSGPAAMSQKKLDVQTRMSSTVFLDPIHANKRTVFVQLRDTSDKASLALEPYLLAALEEKEYQVVPRPDQAQYLLQANVLQVGNTDLRAAEQTLNNGFGATLGTAVLSAAEAERDMVSARTSVLSGTLPYPVYSAVVDVQVSERVGNSVIIKEKTKLKTGASGHQEITSTEKIAWKRYQTRIISTVSKGSKGKMNLKFEQAAPHLVQGLSRSIAGIF